MANSWFQFKEFIIHQDTSAFKVGTDGVLLGAWVNCTNQQSLLDVGTGTGLIALMLAQKNSTAKIYAIELDFESAQMAAHNLNISKWSNRIKLISGDYLEYKSTTPFDHIISNLPFFSNDLKNENARKKNARHDDTLPFSLFLKQSRLLLNENGNVSFILPISRLSDLESTIKREDFYIQRICKVKPQEKKPFHRVMMTLTKKVTVTEESTLIIQNEEGKYTAAAAEMFKDFYLNP